MARTKGLQFAPDSVWTQIRTAPAVDAFVLDMAVKVRDAANEWAESQPRSGKNPIERPHFEVVTQPSRRRARYQVQPATAYATWLVMQKPAEFAACLDAGRRG